MTSMICFFIVLLAGAIASGTATMSFSLRLHRGIQRILGAYGADEDAPARQTARRSPTRSLVWAMLVSPLIGPFLIFEPWRREVARMLVDEAIRNTPMTSEQHVELLKLVDEV